jgi:dTDP-4-dehydrorhamnose 3,5-epimerase
MQLIPTELAGVFLLELVAHEDERGSFMRTFDREWFTAQGLTPPVEQASISRTRSRGTLRGMHYQASPWAEAKLIRVARGVIHDVAIDLRPESPTFRRSFAVELAADRPTALYLAEGLAHGFLTLSDDVEVSYQMSAPYRPEAARGVRFDDPAFGIVWPLTPRLVHPRDLAYPDFAAAEAPRP